MRLARIRLANFNGNYNSTAAVGRLEGACFTPVFTSCEGIRNKTSCFPACPNFFADASAVNPCTRWKIYVVLPVASAKKQ